jgi:hypothetical protein
MNGEWWNTKKAASIMRQLFLLLTLIIILNGIRLPTKSND